MSAQAVWVRANGESFARSVPMLSKRAVVQDMRDKMDIVKKHYETVVSSRPASVDWLTLTERITQTTHSDVPAWQCQGSGAPPNVAEMAACADWTRDCAGPNGDDFSWSPQTGDWFKGVLTNLVRFRRTSHSLPP